MPASAASLGADGDGGPGAGRASGELRRANGLSLIVPRSRIVVQPGRSTRFTVWPRVDGAAVRPGAISLRLLGGVQGGITTRLVRNAGHWALQVRARTAASSGTRTLTLVARAGDRRATTTVRLVVARFDTNRFSVVGGPISSLAPGIRVPIVMVLGNAHAAALRIDAISARVVRVDAPRATASRPCSVRDFRTHPLAAPNGSKVPAKSRRSLAALGYRRAQWPSVELVDRPVNQDGCKGSSVTLEYDGAGVAR